ncbi:Recombination protein RecR [Phycisphaerae bacterium RAS1]|nr:Recombination protein RecR [Phycisphaerae bacterium RAS1]
MSEIRLTGPLQRLIDELKKLPGIGSRSAERVAFHLLKATREEALGLASAVRAVKEQIRPCARCYNLADAELCHICADPRRDPGLIVVVEQPKDLMTLEATGLINGVYHVLMGHIAPLEGVEPEDLTIDALVRRVRGGAAAGVGTGSNAATPISVHEVLLATNPTLEGDATSLHIMSLLRDSGVKITRLARGIAPGAHIEYANRSMLEEALQGRREV